MGARYGTMKDRILALEVVLPDKDATVLQLGSKTLKNREGYDLVRLYVGSEGTLGIVTKAVLKIAPKPRYRGLWSYVDNWCCWMQRVFG